MDTPWIIILTVSVGFVLLLFEVLTPSFGILTVLAAISFGIAVWQGFTISSGVGIGLIVGLAVTVPLYYLVLFKYVAKTAFARKLFLKPTGDAHGEGTPAVSEYEQYVGKTGTAETVLRPSGAVRVDGRRVPALAENGIIEKGSAVTVLRIDGMSLIVKPVSPASSDAEA